MHNSELDCIFYLSNGRGSALADLSGEVEVRIVSMEQKRIASLIHNHPYWHLGIIKRDVWTELDNLLCTAFPSPFMQGHKPTTRSGG
jgi:TRAP-type uncharacterized transport system substrate-binding protein